MPSSLALAFAAAGFTPAIETLEEMKVHPNMTMALQHPAVRKALSWGPFTFTNSKGRMYYGDFLAMVYMQWNGRSAWPGAVDYTTPVYSYHADLPDFEGADISPHLISEAEKLVEDPDKYKFNHTVGDVVDSKFRQELFEAAREFKDSYQNCRKVMERWDNIRRVAKSNKTGGMPHWEMTVEPVEGQTFEEAALAMI